MPWSSNGLREAYRLGAERFGWDKRDRRPGSMRAGCELVGMGMATAAYHAGRYPAKASATLFANGSAVVRSATSDMGAGTYTSITQVATDARDLPITPDKVLMASASGRLFCPANDATSARRSA